MKPEPRARQILPSDEFMLRRNGWELTVNERLQVVARKISRGYEWMIVPNEGTCFVSYYNFRLTKRSGFPGSRACVESWAETPAELVRYYKFRCAPAEGL